MIKGRYAHVDGNNLGKGLTKYIRALLDVYEWETLACSFTHMMRRSSAFKPLTEEVGEHAIPFIFENADKRGGFGMGHALLLSTITEGIDPLDDSAVVLEDGWAKYTVLNVERCWRQWAIEHGYLSESNATIVESKRQYTNSKEQQ